jgi:ATP synthase protein I
MAFQLENKPIRTVLRWQLYASLVLAGLGWIWFGHHGAVSAFLGGLVNVTAGYVYGRFASRRSKGQTAGEVLRSLFRAEASKIILIVMQLALVMMLYRDVVPLAFIGAFVVTVLMFSMAIIVRDN